MEFLTLIEKIREKVVNEVDRVEGRVFIQRARTAPQENIPLPCIVIYFTNPTIAHPQYHELYRFTMRMEVLSDNFDELADIAVKLDDLFVNKKIDLADGIALVSKLFTKNYEGYRLDIRAESYSVTYMCYVLET